MHLIFRELHFYVQKVAMQFCKIAHQSSDDKYWCLDNNYYLSQEDLSTVVPVQKLCYPDTVSWGVHIPHQSKFINTNKPGLAELEWCMEALHFIDEKNKSWRSWVNSREKCWGAVAKLMWWPSRVILCHSWCHVLSLYGAKTKQKLVKLDPRSPAHWCEQCLCDGYF